MREQLTQLIKQAHTDFLYRDDDTVSIYEFIADRLVENGAILPPVKVGQTVWCLIDNFNGAVDSKIYEYTIRSDGLAYFRFTRNGYFTGSAMEDAIGKTVFLTREAAEAALKAREKQ